MAKRRYPNALEVLFGRLKKTWKLCRCEASWLYGKQRCTAYVRYVVRPSLLPRFLDAYLPVLKSLKIGNPLLVDSPDAPLPELDFGPLVNSKKVEELRVMYFEAVGAGAINLYEGELDETRFLYGQDISAHMASIDSIVVVDRIEELISEMNICNGNLVSSIACDDPATAEI